MREEVADVEVPREDDLGTGQVLERTADDEVGGREDDERGVIEADRLHQSNGDAGLRLLDGESIDDSYPALVCLLAERGAQRQPPHLLEYALDLPPWLGTEHDRHALHRELPRAAVAHPAGPFLP